MSDQSFKEMIKKRKSSSNIIETLYNIVEDENEYDKESTGWDPKYKSRTINIGKEAPSKTKHLNAKPFKQGTNEILTEFKSNEVLKINFGIRRVLV